MRTLILGLLAVCPLAAQAVKDPVPLRKTGCAEDDEIIAQAAPGSPVKVRFSYGGACYKVALALDGTEVEGYLPAAALSGLEGYEAGRRAAPAMTLASAEAAPAPPARALASGVHSGHPVVRAVALLEARQPAQALALLEDELRKQPRHARLLATAGTAAFQSDDVRRAVDYFRQSLEIEPNHVVEQLLKRAERELAADHGATEKKFGARFVLRYDGAAVDEESARRMVAVLEEEFSRVAFELGCRTEERITAVVQTREAYLRATDAAEWSGGRYDGRIRVALLEKDFGPRTRRTFAHEIVHACLADLGDWPAWLHEGLAQRLSGETPSPAHLQMVRQALVSGGVPKLNRLGQDWSRMSARHAAIAYGAAWLAVDLFYQHYQSFGIRNLLRSPELLPGIADQLDRLMRQ